MMKKTLSNQNTIRSCHSGFSYLGPQATGIPEDKFDKIKQKVCKCGKKISKYNKRDWCYACQRKGRDMEPKGE